MKLQISTQLNIDIYLAAYNSKEKKRKKIYIYLECILHLLRLAENVLSVYVFTLESCSKATLPLGMLSQLQQCQDFLLHSITLACIYYVVLISTKHLSICVN